jgi:Xaa-Pro aminopeptidase
MVIFWANASSKHVLFVDGRYVLQAAQQLNATMFEVINSGTMSVTQWLETVASTPLRIGFDGWLIGQEQLTAWIKATAHLPITWVASSPNLLDVMWDDRPAAPHGEAVLHPIEFTGASYREKREHLLSAMRHHSADALVLAQPDGINWLCNIRGRDIRFNPLLLSYMILQKDGSAVLYSYAMQFQDAMAAYFSANQIETRQLSEIFRGDGAPIPRGARVMMDANTTTHGWFALAEAHGWEVVQKQDPTLAAKAVKNAVELAGIRNAHVRDGLALTRFLCWFDGEVAAKRLPTELQVIEKLESFRAMHEAYCGPSFATIAGAGPNGAIVHYRADQWSNRRTQLGELFLLDSGGQYADGTTDVTRTVTLGPALTVMKEHFTRVLKGHIALGSAQFPEGTSGVQLDVLARQYLWAVGLDYDHGTGHGVGAYLCVHEGPQRISKKGSSTALVEGMILSNEPGYYAAGKYGIRIENLVVVVARGVTADGKRMLGFETLTLAPIDIRLVEVALLTSDERNWLNQYHARVYKVHAEKMSGSEKCWLEQATKAI